LASFHLFLHLSVPAYSSFALQRIRQANHTMLLAYKAHKIEIAPNV
jgi:hypothetical protein